MTNEVLDEREFELINIIGEELGANQRHLSRIMDLSLGMTNMLIKRLIAKGHIRIHQLNKKKVEYILTPKGFAEKMRKSVAYTLKTINSIGLIKEKIKEVIKDHYGKGQKKFFLLGESDLVSLVEMVVRDMHLSDVSINRVEDALSAQEGVLLVCTEHFTDYGSNNGHIVNLIEELSRDNVLLSVG